VWYAADSPKGPWQVADVVPDEIYTIPPSNPHYNTTYVYVYDSTPEVVYTGYYPGYVNSYVHGGSVVYGTGWYYPPYVSPYVYYPYCPTWGFGVGWNPWTGWMFGVSWGYGPVSITVGFGGYGGYHGWYGPPGYPPPPPPPHYGGYPPRPGVPPGYRPPGYRPPGEGRPPGGSRPGGPQVTPYNNNIYASQQNRNRNATPPRDKSVQTADRAARGSQNNVYAGQNGDVYRRNDDGTWQQRNQGSWSEPSKSPDTRPAAGAGADTRPSGEPSYDRASSLERDYQARARGSDRAGASQGSRGGGGSRGGSRGGGRGGGGRR
jgi:hypothetical protein